MAELWVERTPPDFMFDIKAHALLTGQPHRDQAPAEGAPRGAAGRARGEGAALRARTCPASCATRSGGCSPRASSRSRRRGQLGAVLLQYPRWFFTSSENRDAIRGRRRRRCAARADRSRSSSATRTLVQREERRADAAVPGGPAASRSSWSTGRRASSRRCRRSSRPRRRTWRSSGSTAGERRRGRRRASPTVERFRYLYDRDELAEWAPRIGEARDAGPRDARADEQLLRQLRLDERAGDGGTARGPARRRNGLGRVRGDG